MKPNITNACAGYFQDWLEVMLTPKCNATCSWCIEKKGYKPAGIVRWQEIAEAIKGSLAQNIILLGGEPTLFKDIQLLINEIISVGKDVWITTNGGKLNPQYIKEHLVGIKGINLSIHHYNLALNKEITGLEINFEVLKDSIKSLHKMRIVVRLNCNVIKGYIDSPESIISYVFFAKAIGADKIRFAELKNDVDKFVDLAAMLNYKYGLNDNPFIYGCYSDAVIYDMPVNFRQMCGLQTSRRIKPIDPEQEIKKVLYYDGKFYDGWQINAEEGMMNKQRLDKLLEQVRKGEISPDDAAKAIGSRNKSKNVTKRTHTSSGGCAY